MSTNPGPGGMVNGKAKGPCGTTGRPPRVLFADDSADVLVPLAFFARQRGWEADTATSVDEIMAHIGRRCEIDGDRCYDIFVFDITFKGEPGQLTGPMGPSGVQAVRAIRRKLPNVPVIFVTGWTSRLVTGEAERVGQEVITKPFDPNYVLDRAEVWMAWAGEMRPRQGEERRQRSINRSGYYRRASDHAIAINERVAAAVGGTESPEARSRQAPQMKEARK